jgi:chromosome segregation ATPase
MRLLTDHYGPLKSPNRKLPESYDVGIKKAIETEAVESRQAERAVFELVGEVRQYETRLEHIDRELSVLERDRDEFKRELQEAVALIQECGCTLLQS